MDQLIKISKQSAKIMGN